MDLRVVRVMVMGVAMGVVMGVVTNQPSLSN
jgi:hypothetical protein